MPLGLGLRRHFHTVFGLKDDGRICVAARAAPPRPAGSRMIPRSPLRRIDGRAQPALGGRPRSRDGKAFLQQGAWRGPSSLI
jgi:hypothetical protein